MINHNETDLHRPRIQSGPPDSETNALLIELTGGQMLLIYAVNLTFLLLRLVINRYYVAITHDPIHLYLYCYMHGHINKIL
jgi:hypothetical protein